MTHNGGARKRWACSIFTGTTVAAVVAAGVVIGGTPAVAAGETAATALSLSLRGDLEVGPITAALVSANSRVGHVTAPSPRGTSTGSVGTLTASGRAVDGQARVGALTATRTDIGTRSSAQLVGADVDLLSEGLVTTGDVESSAMCPVGGTPAVQANVVGLRVLGQAVNASVAPVTVTADASLRVAGVTDAKVVATVSSPRSVGSASASVTAVHVSAKVVASVLGGDYITVHLGHVDLASSRCATPSAVRPSSTAVDPDSGPAGGGQIVTITGAAFVPGATTVDFGDRTIPASRVDVSEDGTSLKVTTPASSPGLVAVNVKTPGGTDGPLAYTYIGEGVTAPGGGTNGANEPGGGDDGASDGTGDDQGAGATGATGNDAGSVVPVSHTTTTGTTNENGPVSGLLASTGPLGVIGLAMLGLVLIVSGALLARRASTRPGLAENPWVPPKA